MTDIGNLTAHLGLDTTGLEAGMGRARSAFGGMAAAFGALAAAGVAVAFLKDSVNAAAESEKAYAELGAAVERAGMSWEKNQRQYRAFAATMQRETMNTDEEVARSLQVFVDYGATTEEAFQRTAAASTFAAGKHIELTSATELLAKASVGATQMLGRYGIVVDESASKAEKFDQALAQIDRRWSSAAVAQMDTYAGRLKALANQWDELKEKIGAQALPILTELTGNLNDQITVLQGSTASFWEKWLRFATASREEMATWASSIRAREKEEAKPIPGPAYSIELPPIPEFGPPTISQEDIAAANKAFDDMVASQKTAADEAERMYRALNEAAQVARDLEIRVGTPLDSYQTFPAGTPSAREMRQNVERSTQPNAGIDWVAEGERGGAAFESMADDQQKKQQETEDFLVASSTRAMHGIVDSFLKGKLDLGAIFRQLAQDFLMFFLDEIIKQVALKFATSMLKLLAIFDTHEGDSFAMKQGKDYAGFFIDGMESGLASSRKLDAFASLARPALDVSVLNSRIALEPIYDEMFRVEHSLAMDRLPPIQNIGQQSAGDRFAQSHSAEPAYASRLAPAQRESSVLVITPPMSVSQDYIRKVVAPELRRLALNGARY